jgi:hypothetical protein
MERSETSMPSSTTHGTSSCGDGGKDMSTWRRESLTTGAMQTSSSFRTPTIRVLLAFVSLACLLTDTSLAQSQVSFTRTDITLGLFVGPRQSASGDFNGDGDVDLVIGTPTTAASPAQMFILLGNGDGTFEFAPSVFVAQGSLPACSSHRSQVQSSCGISTTTAFRIWSPPVPLRTWPQFGSATAMAPSKQR